MATLFGMFPFLKTLFADGGYQGPKFAKALAKVMFMFTVLRSTYCSEQAEVGRGIADAEHTQAARVGPALRIPRLTKCRATAPSR